MRAAGGVRSARRPLSLALVAASVFVGTARAGDRSLTPDAAVLAPPTGAVTEVLEPTQGCQALLDTGEGDCAALETEHGTLVFTIEPGPRIDDVLATRPWNVRVYLQHEEAPGELALALTTPPEDPTTGALYAEVVAATEDVTGDGSSDLVVGYRSEGTGQILDVDIVSTTGAGKVEVLAHVQLYKGSAVLKPGRILTWTPVYKKADANCCPTWMRRDVIRYEEGAFVVHEGEKVKTDQANIPAGDL